MPLFRFHCPSCNELIRNLDGPKYKHCPYCGERLVQRGNEALALAPSYPRNVRIPAEDIHRLLGPLVELNGYAWLARKLEVDESRVHRVFKQNYVTYDLADKWLTKLGLTNALGDGSLRTIEYKKGNVPDISPPPSQYFEE